ncbi:hypothetical protein AW734_22210 (plasmid) [Pantoea ananatis]|jgi:hypothetical protein|nr:hypothetical protein AW734_22210 [Pantoea ananatis]
MPSQSPHLSNTAFDGALRITNGTRTRQQIACCSLTASAKGAFTYSDQVCKAPARSFDYIQSQSIICEQDQFNKAPFYL